MSPLRHCSAIMENIPGDKMRTLFCISLNTGSVYLSICLSVCLSVCLSYPCKISTLTCFV